MQEGTTGSTEDGLQNRIQDLQAEVSVLQRRLSKLHGTDAHQLRTAYNSIAQHILALEAEAMMVAHLVDNIDTELVDPEGMADGLASVTAVGGLLFMAGRLVVYAPPPVCALRGKVAAVGGIYVVWRVASLAFKRIRGMLRRNREVKTGLKKELGTVQQRINIMHDLTQWTREARHSTHSSSPAGPAPPAAALASLPTGLAHSSPAQPDKVSGKPGVLPKPRAAPIPPPGSNNTVPVLGIFEALARAVQPKTDAPTQRTVDAIALAVEEGGTISITEVEVPNVANRTDAADTLQITAPATGMVELRTSDNESAGNAGSKTTTTGKLGGRYPQVVEVPNSPSLPKAERMQNRREPEDTGGAGDGPVPSAPPLIGSF